MITEAPYFDFTGKKRLRKGNDFSTDFSLPIEWGDLTSYSFEAKIKADIDDTSAVAEFTCTYLYTAGSPDTSVVTLSIAHSALTNVPVGMYLWNLDKITSGGVRTTIIDISKVHIDKGVNV